MYIYWWFFSTCHVYYQKCFISATARPIFQHRKLMHRPCISYNLVRYWQIVWPSITINAALGTGYYCTHRSHVEKYPVINVGDARCREFLADEFLMQLYTLLAPRKCIRFHLFSIWLYIYRKHRKGTVHPTLGEVICSSSVAHHCLIYWLIHIWN